MVNKTKIEFPFFVWGVKSLLRTSWVENDTPWCDCKEATATDWKVIYSMLLEFHEHNFEVLCLDNTFGALCLGSSLTPALFSYKGLEFTLIWRKETNCLVLAGSDIKYSRSDIRIKVDALDLIFALEK